MADALNFVGGFGSAAAIGVTSTGIDMFYFGQTMGTAIRTGITLAVCQYIAETFIGDVLSLVGVDGNMWAIAGVTLGSAVSVALTFTLVNQFIYRTSPYFSMWRTFIYAFIMSLASGFVFQFLPQGIFSEVQS